jgi:hypothetical protein
MPSHAVSRLRARRVMVSERVSRAEFNTTNGTKPVRISVESLRTFRDMTRTARIQLEKRMSLYKQQVVDPERESGGRFVPILVVEHLGKRPIQVCAHWDAHNIGTNHGTTEPAIRSVASEDWSRWVPACLSPKELLSRKQNLRIPPSFFEDFPFKINNGTIQLASISPARSEDPFKSTRVRFNSIFVSSRFNRKNARMGVR